RSRGGIPALSCERAKRFAAHAQGVSPGADCVRRGDQNAVEKMHVRPFPRLSLCPYEARASAFVRATAILSVAHFLSVSRSLKTAAGQSRARSAIAKTLEKVAAGSHTPAG